MLKIYLADGFYYKEDIIKMLKSRGIFTSLRGDGVLASLSKSKSDKWTQDEFFKLVNSLPPRTGFANKLLYLDPMALLANQNR